MVVEPLSIAVRPDGPLAPFPSGRRYRVTSPPEGALVTRALAGELGRVIEGFAARAGFDEQRPLAVFFRPGVLGHHRVGRAADIYAIDGVGVDEWYRRSRAPGRPGLGLGLYRAMRDEGRWSQPYGYPIQLFGPWTREEGPWRHISESLLRAHDDHIHVAR